MNKVLTGKGSEMTGVVLIRSGGVRAWQRWTPYAAVAWSLVYATLGLYWAVSGSGFPYTPVTGPYDMGPLLGRFGSGVAWSGVMIAGFPAAVMGLVMLFDVRSRVLRHVFITTGVLLSGTLLLLMTGLDLLIKIAYIPAAVLGLFTAEKGQVYLQTWTQWTTIHQILCFIGGFLWLAATVCYGRRSGGTCLYCGRRDGLEKWTNPSQAERWGRVAVVVSMVTPVFYALTRFAWALGVPLGMSEEALRRGQESGLWIAGLSLAAFGLAGAFLTLGLVQRWGEVFPSWIIGLSGRRVPIALAVIPASLVAVLLVVGGIGIWSGLPQMVTAAEAGGARGIGLIGEMVFQVGGTLLFPMWGVALAAATLGYYYRRRGPCGVCGRGAAAIST